MTAMLEFIEIVSGSVEPSDTLTLPFELRQKSRQRTILDNGREAGIVLTRGTRLRHGDVLRSRDGTCVRVCAAEEPVSTLSTDDSHLLARACYHLGNRHVALQIGPGWARYLRDHVLDEMVQELGLALAYETTAFEPEMGAYGGHGHASHHDGAATNKHSVGASTRNGDAD